MPAHRSTPSPVEETLGCLRKVRMVSRWSSKSLSMRAKARARTVEPSPPSLVMA
jgi:hypothetical protein